MAKKHHHGAKPFFSVEDEVRGQTAPSDKLAFLDENFMLIEQVRPIRLQLEYLKPELKQQEQHIESTIVIFGSARIDSPEHARENLRIAELRVKEHPDNSEYQQQLKIAERNLKKSRYYDESRRLAFIISRSCQADKHRNFVVITGGGPGIMEAANRGAYEADAKSIGLNIMLPHEEGHNPYITPELRFQFHYFAMRKMHFLMRARALVFFPGGFGTLDELFETLTLMQTKKITRVPIVLFGESYWRRVINFDTLVEEGAIDAIDTQLFQYAETAEQAWDIITSFYQIKMK